MLTNQIAPEQRFDYDSGIQKHRPEEKVIRYDLDRAMKLGNLYKESVKIRFENRMGELLEEEAIVLTVTEQYVVLRGGTSIPIKSIRKVVL